ncbi:hypothetical protein ACQ4M3_02555 [Leptolyngbya sp. AN03gr2]|uniref:hypothetical protein n=1 Tax=unclassified Leptolyngbya TaxID=2650499 RepID=UPI003D320406
MYNWKLMLGLILTSVLLPVSIAKAEPIAATTSTASTVTTPLLTPYNVVNLAYQGYFREQGLRGYGVFTDGCNQGTLTANDVVRAAIRANRLPESILSDRGFMNAVDANMKTFRSTFGN